MRGKTTIYMKKTRNMTKRLIIRLKKALKTSGELVLVNSGQMYQIKSKKK
jgi:hypothetical protein